MENKDIARIHISTIICTALVIIAVLAFVFGLVYISGNYNFLWFLFLLLTCEFVPTYKTTEENNKEDKHDKR